MGSTWVSYPGLTQVLFTRRRYCCIIRKSSHVANVFKLTFSLLLIVVSPLCISAEKKHLDFWHWIKSSPQTANKADISLSLHYLPRSAILTHFPTSVKSGSTLLLSRIHLIAVVPCKHVNPGSNCFVECMQCPPVFRVLRAASHNRSLSQWFTPFL